jgi:hypothetical protein
MAMKQGGLGLIVKAVSMKRVNCFRGVIDAGEMLEELCNPPDINVL